MISESAARREMIAIGRKVCEEGFVVATDGNLSARIGRDRFLVTRSGVSKGELTDRDLVVCDGNGRVIRGGRVSSEVLLHLAAYRLRHEIDAAIHAHPPTAVAFTLAGLSLSEAILPEVVMSLGSIPTAPFAAPASSEGAEVIREVIHKHDALLLDRHGSLTVGKTLKEAFHKLERLEFAAKVTYAAKALGGEIKALNESELKQVQESLERYKRGASPILNKCPHCGSIDRKVSSGSSPARADKWYGADLDRLAPIIRKIIEEGRM